jgi:hypothetical protein
LRARIFLRDPAGYRLAAELSADDADHAWRQIENDPELVGRRLAAGDLVYIGDEYLEIDGDGGWHLVGPGEMTTGLYRQILDASADG